MLLTLELMMTINVTCYSFLNGLDTFYFETGKEKEPQEHGLRGCNAVKFPESPKFRRYISLLFSLTNGRSWKKLAEAGGKTVCYLLPIYLTPKMEVIWSSETSGYLKTIRTMLFILSWEPRIQHSGYFDSNNIQFLLVPVLVFRIKWISEK